MNGRLIDVYILIKHFDGDFCFCEKYILKNILVQCQIVNLLSIFWHFWWQTAFFIGFFLCSSTLFHLTGFIWKLVSTVSICRESWISISPPTVKSCCPFSAGWLVRCHVSEKVARDEANNRGIWISYLNFVAKILFFWKIWLEVFRPGRRYNVGSPKFSESQMYHCVRSLY